VLQIVFTAGARAGHAGGGINGKGCAKDPYKNAWIYYPTRPSGKRFLVDRVKGQSVPGLYHSVALVLPSGELMVAGGEVGEAKGPGCNGPRFYGYQAESYTYPATYKAIRHGTQSVITQAPAKVSTWRGGGGLAGDLGRPEKMGAC
jgi:hypothetical protein